MESSYRSQHGRKKNKPKKILTDQDFDSYEASRNNHLAVYNALRDEEINFHEIDNQELDKKALFVDGLQERVIHAERFLNCVAEYDDAEYNVEAIQHGDINRLITAERLIIFDTGYEPLNTKITNYINNPSNTNDDFYRRIESLQDIHKMILEIRREGNCSLIEEIFCDDETDPRYKSYVKFLINIMSSVNKKISFKIISSYMLDQSGELNNHQNVTENDKGLFNFQEFSPDEIHTSNMEEFAKAIATDEITYAAKLEPQDEGVVDVEETDIIENQSKKLAPAVNPVRAIENIQEERIKESPDDISVIQLSSDDECEQMPISDEESIREELMDDENFVSENEYESDEDIIALN